VTKTVLQGGEEECRVVLKKGTPSFSGGKNNAKNIRRKKDFQRGKAHTPKDSPRRTLTHSERGASHKKGTTEEEKPMKKSLPKKAACWDY